MPPTSRGGSTVASCRGGSTAPSSRQGSAAPSSHVGSAVPSSRVGSSVPSSHGGSVVPSSCGGPTPPSSQSRSVPVSHSTSAGKVSGLQNESLTADGALPRSQYSLGLPPMTMHVPQERPISPAPPSVGYNSDKQESQLLDEYYRGRATINDDDFPFESTQCPLLKQYLCT